MRLAFRCAALFLCLSWSSTARCLDGHERPLPPGAYEGAHKPGGHSKVRLDGILNALPDLDRGGPSMWRILQKTGRRAEAFAVGSRDDLTRPGAIVERGLKSMSPPDAAAALGLATVTTPDQAGWFVEAGRRIHVRTSAPRRQARIHSYESLVRLGWAVGVAATQPVATRLQWDAGYGGESLELDAFFSRVVEESPDTGVWVVAGLVEMDQAQGCLLTGPPPGVLRPPSQAAPSLQEDDLAGRGVYGLFCALVVRRGAGGPAHDALERFFPADARQGDGSLGVRMHYAPFADPVPEMDPSLPFESIWDVSDRKPVFPGVTSVLEARPGTTIGRAQLAVWAIQRLVKYDLYREPDLVDLLALDPTILVDQRWVTSNQLFEEPIYEKPRLLLQRDVAERVVRIHRRLCREGLRLKVFDAYRPLSVTQRLWSLKPNTPYLADPARGSRHNRGAAVDLTIATADGLNLEMPSDFLDLDERAHRDSPYMTEAARQNMEYLTAVMAAEGFTTIREEWWHYDAPQWEQYPVLDVPLWPNETGALSTVRETGALWASDTLEPPRRRAEMEDAALPGELLFEDETGGGGGASGGTAARRSPEPPDFADAAEVALPDDGDAPRAAVVPTPGRSGLRVARPPSTIGILRSAESVAEPGAQSVGELEQAISGLETRRVDGRQAWLLALSGSAALAAAAVLLLIRYRL